MKVLVFYYAKYSSYVNLPCKDDNQPHAAMRWYRDIICYINFAK